MVWALPRSLAATQGISIDFFSCRYLDGSVPYVSLLHTIYSCVSVRYSNLTGYPIRQSRDHYVFATPPGFSQLTTAFFAGQRQRHPPWTLSRLTIFLFTPSLLMSNNFTGGMGIRTPDIQLAKLTLYQLSYTPDFLSKIGTPLKKREERYFDRKRKAFKSQFYFSFS